MLHMAWKNLLWRNKKRPTNQESKKASKASDRLCESVGGYKASATTTTKGVWKVHQFESRRMVGCATQQYQQNNDKI